MNRRRYLAALGALATTSGCLNLQEASDAETATTQTVSQRTNTSAAPHTAAPTTTEAAPEGTRWLFDAPAPFATPARHHDGVVLAVNSDRHLYALDAADGTQRWRVATTNIDFGHLLHSTFEAKPHGCSRGKKPTTGS